MGVLGQKSMSFGSKVPKFLSATHRVTKKAAKTDKIVSVEKTLFFVIAFGFGHELLDVVYAVRIGRVGGKPVA